MLDERLIAAFNEYTAAVLHKADADAKFSNARHSAHAAEMDANRAKERLNVATHALQEAICKEEK